MPPIESPGRHIFAPVAKTIFIPAFIAAIAMGMAAAAFDAGDDHAAGRSALLPVSTSPATPTVTPPSTATLTPTPAATATSNPTETPTLDASAALGAGPPTLGPAPTATPRPRPQPDGVHRSARVPILMYHYISIPPAPSDPLRVDLSVTPDNFEAQMQWLAENNYHPITLTDLYYHLAVGGLLPDNPIILTFDDGYVDHYENAFPILQKHNFVGTFFVLAGPADVASPRYLTWEMIAEMSAAGQDIQAHGRDHVDMRRRAHLFLYFQIMGARQAVEAHTGKPAPFFAYPAGQYDAATLRFLEEYDFWMAVTTQHGRTHTLDAPLELTRVRIRGRDTLESFISKVTAEQ